MSFTFSTKSKQYALLHIPKNGGSSLWRHLGTHLNLYRPPRLVGHLTYKETREALKNNGPHTYICTIRNPWARMASCYRFIKTRPPSDHGCADLHASLNSSLTFEGFVDNIHSLKEVNTMLKPQGDYLIDENGDVAVDHILKLETLQQDLAPLLQEWALTNLPPLPHINVTANTQPEPETVVDPVTHTVNSAPLKSFLAPPYDYRSLYLNTATKNKVAAFDQVVIDNFNYEF